MFGILPAKITYRWGTQIQVVAYILLSEEVQASGDHYLVAQLEYFAGTINELFLDEADSLAPFCDKIGLSLQPIIPGVGAA